MRSFLIGVVLGAIGGMLYAPATGNRTRALLRDKYTRYSNETCDFIDRHSRDIQNRMQGMRHDVDLTMDQVRNKYMEVSSLVQQQAGPLKDQLMHVREDLTAKAGEVRGRIKEKVGSMRSTESDMTTDEGNTDIYRSA